MGEESKADIGGFDRITSRAKTRLDETRAWRTKTLDAVRARQNSSIVPQSEGSSNESIYQLYAW